MLIYAGWVPPSLVNPAPVQATAQQQQHQHGLASAEDDEPSSSSSGHTETYELAHAVKPEAESNDLAAAVKAELDDDGVLGDTDMNASPGRVKGEALVKTESDDRDQRQTGHFEADAMGLGGLVGYDTGESSQESGDDNDGDLQTGGNVDLGFF